MKKKVLSIMLSLTLTSALLAGCSNTTSSDNGGSQTNQTESSQTEAKTEKKEETAELPILGAGIYSSSDNFNSYIGKAIENASKGVFSTNIEDGQNDQGTQNNQVDTMLSKGAKAIALSVVDVTAAPVLVQKAIDAGNIPIIFFNKEIVDQELLASYDKVYQVTSTGGDYGAAIQGQMVVDYWNAHPEADKNGDGKMQIIVLMGDPGHTAAQPRANYAKSTIEEAGIPIEVIEEDTGMWDTAKAKDKMDAWISKYGDEIEFVICGNDAMALGALQSIEAAGFNNEGTNSEKYIPIIGIDALPEVLDRIESGEMMGSVLQDARTQGEIIVKMADNLVNGRVVLDGIELEIEAGSKAVRVPYQPITKENLDVAEATYAD